ncbi:MAG: hypothetical protein WCB85_14090 [Candidatus Dormiibacterota bacterium]
MTNESASASSALELARRLLSHGRYGQEVELVVGGLPPSPWPADLPLPAEARLLGSALRFSESRPATLEAVFDTSGEPFEVLSAYERQLQELGWNAVEPYDRGPQGGFLSQRGAEGLTLRRGEQGPVLRAYAVAGLGQSIDLRAILELETHFAAQLSDLGWTRVDGRAEDAVAWSSWLLPREGEWRGLLLVIAIFGPTRRSLWLQIESTEA